MKHKCQSCPRRIDNRRQKCWECRGEVCAGCGGRARKGNRCNKCRHAAHRADARGGLDLGNRRSAPAAPRVFRDREHALAVIQARVLAGESTKHPDDCYECGAELAGDRSTDPRTATPSRRMARAYRPHLRRKALRRGSGGR